MTTLRAGRSARLVVCLCACAATPWGSDAYAFDLPLPPTPAEPVYAADECSSTMVRPGVALPANVADPMSGLPVCVGTLLPRSGFLYYEALAVDAESCREVFGAAGRAWEHDRAYYEERLKPQPVLLQMWQRAGTQRALGFVAGVALGFGIMYLYAQTTPVGVEP
jgi:hypothetical protein